MTKYKSIIIEDIPTANGRIYKKGTLQKIKDFLTSDILNKRCFATFGMVDEDTTIDELISRGQVAGLVSSFDIINGQAVLDIELLPTDSGRNLKTFEEIYGEELPFELKVNFSILGTVSEKQNEYGFHYVNISEIKPYVNIIKINGVIEE